MTTHLFSHRDCLFHDTGPYHPERSDRLRAVLHQLDADNFPDLVRHEAPLGTEEQIALVHSRAHIRGISEKIPISGTAHVDADTVVSPGSLVAAYRAVGAAVAAVDTVMAEPGANAFCAIRPPGHHAETGRAMGFCLYNNVAIAARYVQQKYGIERVAIIDFDVHHGNGTQQIFASDPTVFYASSHQAAPFYPGTGDAGERGVGNIVNVPLAAGAAGREFREAYDLVILPALRAFRPQFLLVSAGFDAHVKDPLANLRLTGEDYRWISRHLVEAADEFAEGRLVSLLEGGYDLEGLAEGVDAHVKALLRA